ncbi:MAG: hypothetical protein K2Q26_13655, partial [Bdellovibrionales bacterium]|nr:hypothetical protein [Bdellovibrionales bacterium]
MKTGGIPLEANPVVFTIQILSPVNDCVMYEEQHSINMLASTGVFSLNIGAGIRSGTNFEDTSALLDIFKNGQNFTGITTCSSGTSYNALSGHTRKMRISYNDGGGLVTLAQDFHMQSTPFAWYANSLQGLTPNNFVQVNALQNLTQSNLENLLGGTNYTSLLALISGTSPNYMPVGANGANLPSFAADPVAPAAGATWFDSTTNQVKFYDGTSVQVIGGGGAGTGTVTSIIAGSGLSGGTITTSGTIAIAAGGVTNSMLASGIDAAKITSGTLPLGVIPTGTDTTKLPLAGGTMGGSITMGGFDFLGSGHITMSSQKTITIGKYTNAQQATLIASPLTVANAGATWYNSDTGKLMWWNGSSALEVLDAATAGTIGDITAVNTNAGSGLSGGVATGAATITIVTDNSSTEINGSNQLQLKDLGVTTAKINADAVTTGKILDGTIATADLADSSVTSQKINTVSPTKIVSGPAEYLTYEPAATACTVGQTLKWSAALPMGWICGDDNNAGGDVTAVNTTFPLSGGATSGAISLSLLYDDSTIGMNGSNQIFVKTSGITATQLSGDAVTTSKILDGTIATLDLADDAVTTGKILNGAVTNAKITSMGVEKLLSSSGNYFTYAPNGIVCTNNQVLKWSTADLRWNCDNDIDTNTDAVSSVFTRTGAIVATAGDYTATQITNTAAGNISAVTAQAAINELDTEKVSKAGDTMSGALILNSTLTTNAAVTSTAAITLNAQNEMRFADSDSSNYLALRSPASVTSNITWTLPNVDGASGAFLSTNGSGVLSWVAGNNGDITEVIAGSGLTGGATSGPATLGVATAGITSTHINDGTIATIDIADNAITTLKILDANVTTAKINDGAVTDAKIDTVSIDKIINGGSKYFKYKPNNTNCTNLDTLKWNNALEQWECGSDNNAVVSVFTRTGAVVATAGDYTATQITNSASGNIAAVTVQAALNELDSEKLAKSGDTMTGPLTLNAQNEVRFADSDSSNYVALRSPATVASNITWTLPNVDGLNGTVLTTNGSGGLSWSAASQATSVNANTGTAAAPSISFTTEADTGFYNSNSNAIGVASGGSQTFEFNTVGLQSPTTRGPLITTAAGSATNPTYSFAGDPNTGWYSPSADVLAATTNGSDRMTILANGNVGIGTNNPGARLELVDSGVSNGTLAF